MTMRTRLLLVAALVLCIGGGVKYARGHDIYSDWKMPDNPSVSCCNQHDCRPVTAEPMGGGAWLVNVDGRDVLAPPGKVMKQPSPDGRSHWCGKGTVTYCFLPGEVRI